MFLIAPLAIFLAIVMLLANPTGGGPASLASEAKSVPAAAVAKPVTANRKTGTISVKPAGSIRKAGSASVKPVKPVRNDRKAAEKTELAPVSKAAAVAVATPISTPRREPVPAASDKAGLPSKARKALRDDRAALDASSAVVAAKDGPVAKAVPAPPAIAAVIAAPKSEPITKAKAELKTTPKAKPKPKAPAVIARIDLTAQKMTVSVDGALKHEWRISSGRAGYLTPTGSYKPYRMHKMWYSRKYDNAPMPHAVFYHRGYAVHATYATGRLGRPASHGCIRLSPASARKFYKLVRKYGRASTSIKIVGTTPVARRAYAKRSTKRRRYSARKRSSRSYRRNRNRRRTQRRYRQTSKSSSFFKTIFQ